MASLTNEAKEEVARLLRDGRKIEAIAYLEDAFDVSPDDAKLLAEAVEREMVFSAPAAYPDAVSPTHTAAHEPSTDRAHVEQLLRANQKMEAIKYVRQRQGLHLKDALRRVEEVEREVNPNFKPARGCAGGIFKVAGVIFGLIGLLFVGGATLVIYLQSQVMVPENKVDGVVQALQPGRNGVQAPVIAYTWRGEPRTYRSETYSNPPAFTVGEAVTLYVNPNDASDVVVDTFSERWLGAVIMGVIGGVFAVLSFVFFFVSRRF